MKKKCLAFIATTGFNFPCNYATKELHIIIYIGITLFSEVL